MSTGGATTNPGCAAAFESVATTAKISKKTGSWCPLRQVDNSHASVNDGRRIRNHFLATLCRQAVGPSDAGRGAKRSARWASRAQLADTDCDQRPPAAAAHAFTFGSIGPAARTALPRVGSSAELSSRLVQMAPTSISVGPVKGKHVLNMRARLEK